jgi:hypothetical protein
MTWTPLCLVPGLYLVALAALLAALLRRAYDPIPRTPLLLCGGLLAVLFGPCLVGGRVLLPLGLLASAAPFERLASGAPPPSSNPLHADLLLQIQPWLGRVREAYGAGEWPLWNALAGAGEPLLGNPQAQALQPLAWLALPLEPAAQAGFLAALRVLLAFVFCFLLVRRLGLSEPSALLAAGAYVLGGFLQGWLGWPLANCAALLPALLYAVVLVEERGARRDRALLVAAVAALLVAGHPESELHVLLFTAVFAAARWRLRPGHGGARRAAVWALAAVLAAGLAAPALAPAASSFAQSQRANVLERRQERSRERSPAASAQGAAWSAAGRRLAPIVAPNSLGNERSGRFWGERNAIVAGAGFTGTATLLLALAAAWPLGAGRRLPHERLMLVTAAAALVVLTRAPGVEAAFSALPVVRASLSWHSRIALLLNFTLACLAGCACERWRRSALPRSAVGLAAAALAGLITWAHLAHPAPPGSDPLPALRAGSWALQLVALGIVTALLLGRAERDGRRWPAALVALAVVGELLVFVWPLNPSAPRSLFYPQPRPIALLRRASGSAPPPARVVGLGRALRPNLASVYGLADPRSSNPLRPAAYVEVVAPITAAATQAVEQLDRPLHPLYDLLGVRWVLTGADASLPPPFRLALATRAGRVYERPGALPLLFLPGAVEPCAAPALPGCVGRVEDFARRAVVGAGGGRGPWRAARPADSQVVVERAGRAAVEARAELAEPRLLASSVYQDGGWRLLADGAPLPGELANGPFVAAWLPAGATRIELLYRPPGFVAGMGLASLALAAAAAWCLPAPARTRARSQAQIPPPR